MRASALLLPLTLLATLLLTPASATAATADPTTRSAAAFIARELTAGNGSVHGGSADAGLTIDAILLLAASGTSRDVATRALDVVAARADSYLSSAPAGDPGPRAKLTFALQLGGRDASAHLQALRAAVTESGRVGTAGNEFSHAWAVIALARGGGAPLETVAFLEGMQCTTPGHARHGAFGLHGCSNATADSTGIALIALLAAGRTATDPSIVNAIGWMERTQRLDGSFDGNANATGLVGHAARRIATPAARTVANRAAAFVRELQVTCQSPLIAGNDPTAGGGFPMSWVGAIAHRDDAQDTAIEHGIPAGAVVTWRYATMQAPLTMPGAPNLATVTLATADATTPTAPGCSSSTVTPPPPPQQGTTAPLRVTAAARPVASGSRTVVRITRLAARERFTITVSGRVLARGTATASGSARVRVLVPRAFGTHPRRVLRVLGLKSGRTGSARIATAARARLHVTATRTTVSRRAPLTMRVRGLLPREQYTVRIGRRIIARGAASSRAITVVRTRIPVAPGTRRVTVCGVTCTRTGSVRVTVRP